MFVKILLADSALHPAFNPDYESGFNPNSEVDSTEQPRVRHSGRFTLRPSTKFARTKVLGKSSGVNAAPLATSAWHRYSISESGPKRLKQIFNHTYNGSKSHRGNDFGMSCRNPVANWRCSRLYCPSSARSARIQESISTTNEQRGLQCASPSDSQPFSHALKASDFGAASTPRSTGLAGLTPLFHFGIQD